MSDNYQKFLNSNTGKNLLIRHNLHEQGLWVIIKEEPKGRIVLYEGKLQDILLCVVDLPFFWLGDTLYIHKCEVKTVQDLQNLLLLQLKKEQIEQQLKNVEKELGEL